MASGLEDFLFWQKKALLTFDSMRAYVKDSMKLATKKTKFILAVITGGTTKYLQTLDIGVNCAFKVTLTKWVGFSDDQQWEIVAQNYPHAKSHFSYIWQVEPDNTE